MVCTVSNLSIVRSRSFLDGKSADSIFKALSDMLSPGWQKLHGSTGGPPKSLDSDENFKLDYTLFCRELKFVAIYALSFGDLWA